MRLHELKDLIRVIDQSSIQEFELEQDGVRVVLKKAVSAAVAPVSRPEAVAVKEEAVLPQPVQKTAEPVAEQPKPEPKPAQPAVAENAEADANLHQIVSPMVGTFYRAPAPDAPPYVEVGDQVNEKTVVCIVEAMKLMNEIEAEVSGEIVAIHAENGQLVEYGQPLFTVKVK
ncbi:MAG: acetyl-CoA carboxylase, biotin carboxyl carrier protein [Bacillus thermozeamaize]|jgi:acetyl-CoA carboxylase biotin carboxyl carrier protein|uniref:Biotin carboxyl carrier protein of acetyl-CoA carboxylase n=1 Tax=Bacillus thermozeamaize TaxID=230954 RepID=A0A1Y3PBT5_9BACI|nr:MAG: acetyl-CoA carboxylase, biotin carboxyl carrier protein [Bacillus thermozeamaize]